DAVEAHAGRWVAHVGIKIFKDQPALANGDATAAVPGVSRVKAARLHVLPAIVGATATQAVLGVGAAAAFRASALQIASAYDAFAAAVTATQPKNERAAPAALSFWKWRNHAPAAEPLASEVYEPVAMATGGRATPHIASQYDALVAAIATADPPG